MKPYPKDNMALQSDFADQEISDLVGKEWAEVRGTLMMPLTPERLRTDLRFAISVSRNIPTFRRGGRGARDPCVGRVLGVHRCSPS